MAGLLMYVPIAAWLWVLSSDQIVCTRTLYNYVDQGLLAIRNSDLPEKLKRNTKIHRVHKNKKKLGRSIEERPKEINKRNELAIGNAI